MKIKTLIPLAKDGKTYEAGETFDIKEKEAMALVNAGAAVFAESGASKNGDTTLPPLSIEELAQALFDKHSEFKEEDFRKDSKLPKADAVRRVLKREDVGGELLEQALELLEEKLKG